MKTIQKTLLTLLVGLSFNAMAVSTPLMPSLTLTKTSYTMSPVLVSVEEKETLLSIQKENFNPEQFVSDQNHILDNKLNSGEAFFITYQGMAEGKANFKVNYIKRTVEMQTVKANNSTLSAPHINQIDKQEVFSVKQEKGQLHRNKTVNFGELFNDNNLSNYQLTVDNF